MIKRRQKKEKDERDAENKKADMENKGMDGDVDAPPRETAVNDFYNDDCYKAMVDAEY